MKLKLYVKSWCPWCVAAKEKLDSLGAIYEMIDVEKEPAGRAEMLKLSGQTFVPVLAAEGLGGRTSPAVLADFGPEEIEGFFEKYEICP